MHYFTYYFLSISNCKTTHYSDEQARRLLNQAEVVHFSTVEDSVVTMMYNRLKTRGKVHNEILIACSHKLFTIIWSVLRNRHSYINDAGLLVRTAGTKAKMEDHEKE